MSDPGLADAEMCVASENGLLLSQITAVVLCADNSCAVDAAEAALSSRRNLPRRLRLPALGVRSLNLLLVRCMTLLGEFGALLSASLLRRLAEIRQAMLDVLEDTASKAPTLRGSTPDDDMAKLETHAKLPECIQLLKCVFDLSFDASVRKFLRVSLKAAPQQRGGGMQPLQAISPMHR